MTLHLDAKTGRPCSVITEWIYERSAPEGQALYERADPYRMIWRLESGTGLSVEPAYFEPTESERRCALLSPMDGPEPPRMGRMK